MTEHTGLSVLLKRYRMAAGLSQEALAARAGISARAISDLERGRHRTPHPNTLDVLATALSLSAQQRAVLLTAAHPELDGTHAAPAVARASNVPLPPTSLIGREQDCARALGLLRTGHRRLLTLTGPSGVGKTRLALQIAPELAATCADGAAFVDLAAIREGALVPGAVAQALGLHERGGATLAAQVRAYLQDKQILLALDNFEHLLEAASFVADLLACCPRLVIVVTSRTPLRLRAEQTLAVAPLPLEEAITLFRERAQAVRPDGAYNGHEVAAICERVDCLPLAIELAAAQIRMLSLAQICEHLTQRLPLLRGGATDLPARQRTMEDAIGWGYELLTESQQRCFRALGVFVGGWTLEAAQAVCWDAGSVTAQEALLTLAALVDASMVQAELLAGGVARFGMLELLREYALDRLRAADEEEVCRRRHAAYYAHLAESVAALSPGPSAGHTQHAQELANARAALEWAEERREAEIGLRLTGFTRLWYIRGQIGEAQHWFDQMLALDARAREQNEPTAPLTLRVERLYGFGRVLLGAGEMKRAETVTQEALRLARRIGDEKGIGNAFGTLGLIAQASGKLDQAAAAFADSYAHARLTEDSDVGILALVNLAELARARDDLDRAALLLEEALNQAHAATNTWTIAIITTLLGHVARQQQRYSVARVRYRESLALLRPFGSPTYTAWCLEGLAATLCAEGRYALATRLCAAATMLRQQARSPLPPAERATFEQTVTAARAALDAAVFGAEWAAGSALSQEAAVAAALVEAAQAPALEDALEEREYSVDSHLRE
jgi:predicted ATPase/transcriptional regulator with XRE-family HTH domain